VEGNLKAAVVGRLVVVRGPRGRSSPMARRGPPLAVRSHTADLPVADLFMCECSPSVVKLFACGLKSCDEALLRLRQVVRRRSGVLV